jgi:hypothetical protein
MSAKVDETDGYQRRARVRAAWFFYSKAITRSLKWTGCFGMRDRKLGIDSSQPPEKVGRRNGDGSAAVSMPLAESSHHRPMTSLCCDSKAKPFVTQESKKHRNDKKKRRARVLMEHGNFKGERLLGKFSKSLYR